MEPGGVSRGTPLAAVSLDGSHVGFHNGYCMSRRPDALPPIGRILGIDPGTHRIGVAVSDPMRILAQPLVTVRSRGERRDVEALGELARRHEVVAIVVGLPLNMDGTPGTGYDAAERLMERLRQVTGLPVMGWDERLTSAQAERTLVEAGVSARKRRRRGATDRVAAALILESFLASLGEAGASSGDDS